MSPEINVPEFNNLADLEMRAIETRALREMIFAQCNQERERQDEKHGDQSIGGQQNHDPFKWISIELEEFGEASRATNDWFSGRPDERLDALCSMCEEWLHVMAVACAAIECLERNWGGLLQGAGS